MRRKIQALSAHFYRNAQNCTDCVSDGSHLQLSCGSQHQDYRGRREVVNHAKSQVNWSKTVSFVIQIFKTCMANFKAFSRRPAQATNRFLKALNRVTTTLTLQQLLSSKVCFDFKGSSQSFFKKTKEANLANFRLFSRQRKRLTYIKVQCNNNFTSELV